LGAFGLLCQLRINSTKQTLSEEIDMTGKINSRRQFLKTAGFGAAVSLAGAGGRLSEVKGAVAAQKTKPQFELGLASYTFRKYGLDDTLAMTKRLGLKYVAFKSYHLPLESTPEQISAVVEKVKEAGLELYGGGVIYMKNESEVNRAFDYAKAAGMKVIIGVPNHDLLPLVDKKVRQHDIKVAIHNHGPTDKVYPTPQSAYEKIKDLDKRIGLCIDIGHTQRADVDPSVSAQEFADRLLDVHIKDVSQASADGRAVEIGRGVIDIPKFLRTLLKINYSGITSFEYEKDADDPLAGVAESVGYVRGALAAIT
jgi:sugar phosphate isomerase/epimerase